VEVVGKLVSANVSRETCLYVVWEGFCFSERKDESMFHVKHMGQICPLLRFSSNAMSAGSELAKRFSDLEKSALFAYTWSILIL
jgi:hypothetical protein